MAGPTIIGFTADADVWCEDCAVAQYGPEIMTGDVEDSEGNTVHPIFSTDSDSYLDHCGQCGEALVDHNCADHDDSYPDYLDAFTYAYAECMIWANVEIVSPDGEDTGERPEPAWWQSPARGWQLDAFDEASRKAIREDCEDFVLANWSDLRNLDPSQCGHDFALTRNHHGAGFWDRGLGELGDRLTKASHPYGESSGFVGADESEIHLH